MLLTELYMSCRPTQFQHRQMTAAYHVEHTFNNDSISSSQFRWMDDAIEEANDCEVELACVFSDIVRSLCCGASDEALSASPLGPGSISREMLFQL